MKSNNVAMNRPLMEGAVAVLQKETNFFALKTFPVVYADSNTGTYKYWDLEDLLRHENEMRKPGSNFKRVQLDVAEQSFTCENYGLEVNVAREDRQELGGNPLQTKALYLMRQGLVTLDVAAYNKYFATSGGFNKVYDVASSLSSKQWDAADSNPIKDIEEGLDYIEDQTGLRPNVLTMTKDVFRKLKHNPELLDRQAVDKDRGITTEEEMAKALGVEEVVVAKGTYISGNEKTSETRTGFGTKRVVATYRQKVAPADSPNAGLIIIRDYGDLDGATGMGIETYFDKPTESDIVRLWQRFTPEVSSKDLGVVFDNCIA